MKETKSPVIKIDSENITAPPGFGARYTLALMGLSGLLFTYACRVDLSVAIVAMVNSTSSGEIENSEDTCPYPENYNSSSVQNGEFNWDAHAQGLILGAYFYGYIITSILGGVASERWGGKIVLGCGVLTSSLITLVLPVAARLSAVLFFFLFMLIGCASGVVLPAVYNIIPKWYPKMERSKFTTFIFSGIHVGTVLTLPISGFLGASDFLGGWPSIFYVVGLLGTCWSLLWFWVVSDDPRDHPTISDEELRYIEIGCPQNKERLPVPWVSIFKSKYFWSITIMHFGNNWGFYTLLTELPTYLDQILHLDMTSNGLLSALPFLAAWIISLIFSVIVDKLLTKKIITRLFVRRISMILGGYGSMVALISMMFANCNIPMAITILIISGGFNGFTYTGFFCSHADISPRFAGTLMGLTNVPGTAAGFLSPAVAGILTEGNQTVFAWKMVFLIAGVLYGLTTTVYITVITTDVQEWNNPPNHKKQNGYPGKDIECAEFTNEGFQHDNNTRF